MVLILGVNSINPYVRFPEIFLKVNMDVFPTSSLFLQKGHFSMMSGEGTQAAVRCVRVVSRLDAGCREDFSSLR